MTTDVFLSIGRTATKKQEAFVAELERALAAEGLTVRRSQWSSVAPLKKISEVMQPCKGAVIVAHERIFVEKGSELRGGKDHATVNNVKLPTVWNQIEAAMAYKLHLPLFVICEKGARSEGLLESKYDWMVNWIDIDKKELNSNKFRGILADWKARVLEFEATSKLPPKSLDKPIENRTVGDLLKELKPGQGYTLLATIGSAIGAMVGFAFWFGMKVAG